MVIFFTGTGNSRYAARRIAEVTEDELHDSFKAIRENQGEYFESQKPLVFVCPTYAYRIPRVFEKYIRQCEFIGNKEAYFVMTCGSYIGSAQTHIEKMCDDLGLKFMGVANVVMPENYICMFDSPTDEQAHKIICAADKIIDETANAIKNNKRLKPIRGSAFMTYFVNAIFYRLFVNDKKFYTTDDCTGCGMCSALCPMNNIKMHDKHPVWQGKCTQCQCCIAVCPHQAIEYGEKAKGKNRYYLK